MVYVYNKTISFKHKPQPKISAGGNSPAVRFY